MPKSLQTIYVILILLLVLFIVTFAWGETSEPIDVYILDDGIRFNHFDLRGLGGDEVDIIGKGRSGRIHGTAIASIIGGRLYDNELPVRVHSVRVLQSDGSGKWSDFLKGLQWVLEHHEEGRMGVVNLSFGGRPKDVIAGLVGQAIARLQNEGLVVVSAIGNDGERIDEGRIPCSIDGVISVGALNRRHTRWVSSNFGDLVDYFVLGEDLRVASAIRKSARTTISGTSFSAAIISAVLVSGIASNEIRSTEEVAAYLDSGVLVFLEGLYGRERGAGIIDFDQKSPIFAYDPPNADE
ncbi:S8 family serine peptidase [Puniceicoccaceae bacterium K14]|nr:S8 family serine peptidase [Puniceicoccaceae bacterium K14]